MAAGAHLTILWGRTPIGLHHLRPGRGVEIAEGGVVTRAARRGDGAALIVRMDARGATVSRPGSAEGRRIPTGADLEIAIDAPGGAAVYRRGEAWEPEPVVLRVAVTAEDPRPFRRTAIARRAVGTVAAVAAAVAMALAVAGNTRPPPRLSDIVSIVSTGSDVDTQDPHVDAVVQERYRDVSEEDRFGDAPAVCTWAADRIAGRSISIRGPHDNPDPHIRRSAYSSDELTFDGIGLRSGGYGTDDPSPIAPWGRDDALGVDTFSATGTVRGEFAHSLWATCFGAPPETFHCAEEPPDPPTPESLGLLGIGEAAVWSPERPAPRSSMLGPGEPWRFRERARVVVGPIAVSANVPRWVVASSVRDAVESIRGCYERALLDDATLTGRFDAVLQVRGEKISVHLDPKGSVASVPALRCCVDHAHEFLWVNLPKGTQATARYAIALGG